MLKFQPIDVDFIKKFGSIPIEAVSTSRDTVTAITNPSVLSMSPYKSNVHEKEKADTKIYTGRTHIRLNIPVVNLFLAGRNCGLLSKVLGIDVSPIAKGSSIVMLESDGGDGIKHKIVSASNLNSSAQYDPETMLIGGRAVEYLLKTLDINERLIQVFESFFFEKIKEKERKLMNNFHDVGYVVNKREYRGKSGPIWIIDDYYLVLINEDYREKFSEDAVKYRKAMFEGEGKGEFMSKVGAMLAFRDNPKNFYGQVLEYLPVLPIGYRPTIENRIDPLSILYNRLVKRNLDLKSLTTLINTSVGSVRLAYIELYTAYENLCFKKSRYDDDRFKPLMDLLTGKEGLIRGNVQSTTIDYSGRAVITVDPFMSVDTIGVPESMAIDLCHLDALKMFKVNTKNKSNALSSAFKNTLVQKAKDALAGAYVPIGRQPTLHYLGIQAFKVKVIKGNSIVLNPLSTTAFNADFDGDQMHINMPITDAAKREVATIMASINNIFLPRDGSSHVGPRQEMIYGLYKCHKAKLSSTSQKAIFRDVNDCKDNILDRLKHQEIFITDECIVAGESKGTVGEYAIRVCLGTKSYGKVRLGVIPITTDETVKEKTVTEKFFREFIKHVKLNKTNNVLVETINNLVALGFIVAKIYPPDISVLHAVDTTELIKKFDEDIKEREKYYNIGFETESSFSQYYNERYQELDAAVYKEIVNSLDEDNGYREMIDSGARGSKSNMLQLFGMKGVILKNEVESFNAIIKNSLSAQLTGLEHFITAYGSRQGIIDKVINTHKPGYLARQLSHVGNTISINSDDCGTTEGIHITYKMLKYYISQDMLVGDDTMDNFVIKEYAVKLLTGRYLVGGVNPLTAEDVSGLYNTKIAELRKNGDTVEFVEHEEGLLLRSPIKCKSQCCVKCYGVDLATNKKAVVGTAIGYLAAQSIGEPVTQLIMKNFQKGGVAGAANLTSSFDVVTNLFELHSVSKGKSDEPIIHDMIAPASGYIVTQSRGDGTKRVRIQDEDGKNVMSKTVYVYDYVKLKEYVEKGEPIQVERGMLDINEILQYVGWTEAQMYLLFSLYNVYYNQVFVNMKHFEVIVAGMTFGICTMSDGYFKTGNYYTLKEIRQNKVPGNTAKFVMVIRGIKQVPRVKNNVLEAIYLENVGSAMSRAMAVSSSDDLTNPFVRTTLGLNIGTGTDVDGYLERRGV